MRISTFPLQDDEFLKTDCTAQTTRFGQFVERLAASRDRSWRVSRPKVVQSEPKERPPLVLPVFESPLLGGDNYISR
eukprot:957872-Prorocentrum_minimum.AAC.7